MFEKRNMLRLPLPNEELEKVSHIHILEAIDFLQVHKNYANFKSAKSCYLVFPLCPPLAVKMVFGKALSICRNGERIRPFHFNSRTAIKILQMRGFECINTQPHQPSANDRQNEREYEGQKRLQKHYVRERNRTLAKRKKEMFKLKHGYLFCELCGLKPTQAYGKIGESCIEVHHKTPLSSLSDTRETTLDDLQCLCANCHRIEHAIIRDTKS